MIYTSTHEPFSLISSWSCSSKSDANGNVSWYISNKPTEAKATHTFAVSLPADAVIERAWISVKLGSPLSGAAYKRINGVGINASGEVELTDITPSMTSYQAVYTFKAYGRVYQDTSAHRGVLPVDDPTLHIQYRSQSQGGGDSPGGGIIREVTDKLQLPRLLNADLTEARRLTPYRCGVALDLKTIHTATLDVPAAEAVKCRDFVELFTPLGSAGIFRVTDTEAEYGKGDVQTLHLESAIVSLADDIVIGVQPMSGSVQEVLATLLDAQSIKYWVIGECDVPQEYELIYEYSSDNILEAITKLLGHFPDQYYLQPDTMQIPFVLNVRRVEQDDSCELRMSRNLETAKISIDARQLCTRIYPFGSGEGTDRISLTTLTGSQYLDADTVATWGVVAQTFAEDDIFDALTLRDVAERYLERYKDPIVSIETTAFDLSKATGMAWDRLSLGKRCRLALPKHHDASGAPVVMHEIIIGQEWDDVYGDPTGVKLLLANRVRDATDEIAGLLRAATSSKLIGGTVKTEESSNASVDITSDAPAVHYFDVSGYGNLLAARVTYTATDMDTGRKSACRVSVDGTQIDNSAQMGSTIEILSHLTKDENGIPTVGQHKVSFRPTDSSGWYRVSSKITIKTIEKR